MSQRKPIWISCRISYDVPNQFWSPARTGCLQYAKYFGAWHVLNAYGTRVWELTVDKRCWRTAHIHTHTYKQRLFARSVIEGPYRQAVQGIFRNHNPQIWFAQNLGSKAHRSGLLKTRSQKPRVWNLQIRQPALQVPA